MLVSLGFIVAALFVVAAQSSQCPAVEVQADFDLRKYLGRWYEVERFPMIFEMGGSCVTAEYNQREDGFVNVYNRMFSNMTQQYVSIEGTAKMAGDLDSGKLIVSFGIGFPDADYIVVSTDYDNYSVVFSCMEFGGLAMESSWVLSRTPVLPTQYRGTVEATISRNAIDSNRYEKTEQANYCMYQ